MQEINEKNQLEMQEVLAKGFREMEAKMNARFETIEKMMLDLAGKDSFGTLEQRLEVLEAKKPVVELAELSQADLEALELRLTKRVFGDEVFEEGGENICGRKGHVVDEAKLGVENICGRMVHVVNDNLKEMTTRLEASLSAKFSTKEEIENLKAQTDTKVDYASKKAEKDFLNLYQQMQKMSVENQKVFEKQKIVSSAPTVSFGAAISE